MILRRRLGEAGVKLILNFAVNLSICNTEGRIDMHKSGRSCGNIIEISIDSWEDGVNVIFELH